MNPIIVTNIISEKMISVNFDLNDVSSDSPSIELDIEGDIDLNALVIKLAGLIENKRTLNVEFQDTGSLLDSNSKITLIKNTLDEVYSKFNIQFDNSDNLAVQNAEIADDSLPF